MAPDLSPSPHMPRDKGGQTTASGLLAAGLLVAPGTGDTSAGTWREGACAQPWTHHIPLRLPGVLSLLLGTTSDGAGSTPTPWDPALLLCALLSHLGWGAIQDLLISGPQ